MKGLCYPCALPASYDYTFYSLKSSFLSERKKYTGLEFHFQTHLTEEFMKPFYKNVYRQANNHSQISIMNKVSRQQFFVCFSRGKQGSVLKFLSMQLHIRSFLAAGGICGHPIRMKEKNEGKKN